MTIPQQPPDREIPEPGQPETDIPPEGPIPESPPEFPEQREPDWRAPGSEDAPMRGPGEEMDA